MYFLILIKYIILAKESFSCHIREIKNEDDANASTNNFSTTQFRSRVEKPITRIMVRDSQSFRLKYVIRISSCVYRTDNSHYGAI